MSAVLLDCRSTQKAEMPNAPQLFVLNKLPKIFNWIFNVLIVNVTDNLHLGIRKRPVEHLIRDARAMELAEGTIEKMNVEITNAEIAK